MNLTRNFAVSEGLTGLFEAGFVNCWVKDFAGDLPVDMTASRKWTVGLPTAFSAAAKTGGNWLFCAAKNFSSGVMDILDGGCMAMIKYT